jgi:anaerobic magnesium-protoporphyrin IX monomethyl ester cyclase
MRILFVYPNLRTQLGFNHGLLSLSAVLEEAGHETRLFNCNEELPPVPTDEELLELIEEWRPGLVGFSCLTQQHPRAREMATFLREQHSRGGVELPPLVAGGIHPTLMPEEVMAEGVWDHVAVGECEEALLELVEKLERGEPVEEVRSFLSWRGGERPPEAAHPPVSAELWVHNPVREFPDLAVLPAPNYELFDVERILEAKNGWFSLMSSRGCAYRCTYCLNHKVIDRYRGDLGVNVAALGYVRTRPAELVIDEIENVLERYPGIKTFIFDDDLFTQNVEHALAVCEAYEKAGIGIPLVVNAHVQRLDDRVSRALASAGARILKIGIESGSPRVRTRILKRHMRHQDIIDTVGIAEGHGLHTSGFVMVGLPTESREERWETVDLLAESRIGRFRTSFFYPFPGTESWGLTLEAGHLDRAALSSATSFTDRSCLDFGAEENLFVDKVGKCMPWFVNSRLDRFGEAPSAERYRSLVEEVLAMDRTAWEAFRPGIEEVDGRYSAAAAEAGELHYAIRYNEFMGVRSDYYLAEEKG